uniref:Putative secreted protein n=1 Tax=Anopheles marajoara TaxID=58244 RepID=A0A2M4CFG2_9DIPT
MKGMCVSGLFHTLFARTHATTGSPGREGLRYNTRRQFRPKRRIQSKIPPEPVTPGAVVCWAEAEVL